MQNFLDLPEDDQRIAFEQTAAATGLVASSVEKDFWVCWALGELFALPVLKDSLVFRGGTSLSKVWGLIDRFSEDIDLTIDRKVLKWEPGADLETMTPSQQGKRVKALRKAGRRFVGETIHPALTAHLEKAVPGRPSKIEVDEHDNDGQTLLLHYPAVTGTGVAGYVAPVVKMEFGVRSEPWPTRASTVRCFVAETFREQFGQPDVPVTALLPARTLLEKVLALHEENCRPERGGPKPRMARHYYDVHRLVEAGIAVEVLGDLALLQRVVRHRAIFFRQSWMNYDTLKPGNLRIRPAPEQEAAWRADYDAMGAEMFRNAPPPFDDLMKSADEFERRLNALAEPSAGD